MKASKSEFDPGLRIGEALTNEELSRLFQCSTYGGMRRSHRTNTLVLISKGSGGTYFDRWDGETFHYTGMGLTGDQKLEATQNKTLAESDTNGAAVFLFENPEPNRYLFLGRVGLAGAPYLERQPDRDGNERRVWVFPLAGSTSAAGELLPLPFEKLSAREPRDRGQRLPPGGRAAAVGVDIPNTSDSIDDGSGEFRLAAREALVGQKARLEHVESGQQGTFEIVRADPDPAAKTITLESPIAKELLKAGGPEAPEGALITIQGRPLYRLLGFVREPDQPLLARAVVEQTCGWYGTVAEFLALDQSGLLSALCARHMKVMNMQPDGGQMAAWRGEFEILQSALAGIVESASRAARWVVVFEYELPRERGRRPDVVILTGSQVLVLEFKETERLLRAYVDQVDAYARDLRHYHAATHDKLVDSVLVLTRGSDERRKIGEVTLTNAAGVQSVIAELERRAPDEPVDGQAWIEADYSPLPSLVTAARRIFEHEPLPQIRKAQSAGIPETIAKLVTAANEARDAQELHLALITGVPGSGKTLVGLQFVYENFFGDTGSKRSAVFLSGNGPLVDVLQYALKSKVFVQDVHGFLKQYGGETGRIPEEHVWVYDEAQRAWDAERVREKRGHDHSEPEDFLLIGSRKRSWGLMVGLIGQGQEIYLGEEAGLGQWNDAVGSNPDRWTVHCPSKIADIFSSAGRLDVSESLNLDVSLRSHIAEDVQGWVQNVLDGRLEDAAPLCQRMERQGYRLYVTRELTRATRYVRERYRTEEDKRYGFLGSSKGRLNDFGIPTDFYSTQRMKVGPWYYDPPESTGSCCQLDSAATEFQCQGLELDLPVVGWGVDLHWNGGAWQSPLQKRSHARDPHKLRLNSYRVLLTRGRDGSVLYVPDGGSEFNADYEALLRAGATAL
jgi:hypothetical protein